MQIPAPFFPMLNIQLKPHISFAIVAGHAVFLDLRRDRYFALDRATAEAFEQFRSNSNGLSKNENAATLIESGLFTAADGPSKLEPVQLPIAERGLPDDPEHVRLCDVGQILPLVFKARSALRSKPLEQIISKRRRRASVNVKNSERRTLDLAQRFRCARALIPIAPTCLQDSLALHDWLAEQNASSLLVLGVRHAPFAAHSWVQLGDVVLNDAPDRVAAYTPILVIE